MLTLRWNFLSGATGWFSYSYPPPTVQKREAKCWFEIVGKRDHTRQVAGDTG